MNKQERVEVVKRMVQIADSCMKFQNFSDAASVVAGLNFPAISRLKKTWKVIESSE